VHGGQAGVTGEIISERNIIFALPRAQRRQGTPHVAMHLLAEGRGERLRSLFSDWLVHGLGLLAGVASE
jgi:hypothetical protein